MINLSQIIMLAPDRINISDPCLFWAREPDEDFLQSVKNLGQTEPVLIVTGSREKVLVAGYKRTLALRSLGREIMAMEIPPADPYSRGLIYLATNHGQALDQEKIIPALRYFSSINSISGEVWKRVGVAADSKIQGLWQSWLALPLSWDRLLALGNISLESSRILKNLGNEDLEALYPFFAELSWSKNNCLNLLTWLSEKARMEQTKPADVIKGLELEKILKTGLSPADKIKSILRIVFQARYPVLSEMKNHLNPGLRSISAGTGWRFEHKDEFESTEIEISARIKSRQDLEKALAGLEKIFESGVLEDWPVK